MNATIESPPTQLEEKKRRQTARAPLPEALSDMAFLDIRDLCALVRMGPSWVHNEVREGRFPQPFRFGPRCTRWKAADIRKYLIERAAQPQAEIAALVTARAKCASAKARTPEAVAKAKATRATNRASTKGKLLAVEGAPQ